jgi:hypothetical protein
VGLPLILKGIIMLKLLWIVLNIVLFGILSIAMGYFIAVALTGA